MELQKEECINHIAKRLGIALRKLASSGKKHGVTLGGRGHGKLKQATILKLTAYYDKAVRANSNNLDAMRDAVLATFDYATSTDERPHHDRCPVGADSWCFYQKSLATGEVPGPHRDLVGTPLSADVAKQVEGVYLRLSHDNLLRRCLRGVTQNANESPLQGLGQVPNDRVCRHQPSCVLHMCCGCRIQQRSGGHDVTPVQCDGRYTWLVLAWISREGGHPQMSASRAPGRSLVEGCSTCSPSCPCC